jgi:hypothetical protein
MHTIFRLLVMVGLIVALPAQADVLNLPADPVAAMNVPARGMSRSAVERQFGNPMRRHAPVGGGNPQQPPITRCDYDGWSVFYESGKVIDVVVKDAPAPIHNVEALQGTP